MKTDFVQSINERIPNVSFARFIALCFIVACHILQYFGYELAWWLNVGVQMFLFISGFLYGNKNIDDPINFIKKNFKKILVPYYCFLLPVIFFYCIFSKTDINFRLVIQAILCSRTIKGIGHLWFISYILFCYLITPYLCFLKNRLQSATKFKFFGVFLIIFVFGDRLFSAYNSYFYFDRIFCYITGYFVSMFLNMYGLKALKKLSKIVIVFAVSANGLRILCKYFIEFAFPKFDLFEAYCHVILGVAIVLFIILYVKDMKYSKVLAFSDKYSYYIYLVHQLFILSPFTLLNATQYFWLNLFLVLISIILSSVALYLISQKILKLKTIKLYRGNCCK